jgi:hypothetical protein
MPAIASPTIAKNNLITPTSSQRNPFVRLIIVRRRGAIHSRAIPVIPTTGEARCEAGDQSFNLRHLSQGTWQVFHGGPRLACFGTSEPARSVVDDP